MGEVYQYHISMLVSDEQELAIRTMFKDRDWPCRISVISDETVADIKQSGYAYVFPETTESQDDAMVGPAFTEIKTEVVNIDDEDTNSAFDYDTCDSPVKSETLGMSADHAADDSVDDLTTSCITPGELPASHYAKTYEIPTASSIESTGTHTSGYADVGLDSTTMPASYIVPKVSGIPSFGIVTPRAARISTAAKRSRISRSYIEPEISSISTSTSKLSGRPTLSCITESGLVVPGTYGVPASGFIATQTSREAATFDSSTCVKGLSTDAINLPGGIPLPDSALQSSLDNKSCKNGRQENVVSKKRSKDNTRKAETSEEQKKDEEPLKLTKDQPEQPYNGAFNNVLCVDCPSRFFSWEDLWKHRNEAKHDLPKVKPYGWAKRNFSPEELQQMGYLICNACNNYFPDKRKLRQHCYAIHRELMPSPSCTVCGAEFLSHKELHKHKREKQHNDSLWLLNSYQCDMCGKHMTKYENFKRHKLLSCGKSEMELEELRIHPCEVCGKRFKSSKAVRVHINIVHENTESICDICGKLCKSKFALRGHKRRHNEKNRKFVCEDCGKAFFASSLLQQHMRTHTKEKPFKCPLCEYTCSLRENVHKHARNVHKEQITAVDLRKETIP